MYWDNYGLFATGSFDSICKINDVSKTFVFNIYKKNFDGTPINCLCAKDPAIHTWLDDNPTPSIKGSELKINLINLDNSLPLITFYSDEDDAFKIVLYVTYPRSPISISKELFTGYLVQDDCSEIVTDIAHEIQLTFTDNLGILKDISFDLANKWSSLSDSDVRELDAYLTIIAPTSTDSGYFIVDSLIGNPVVGNSILLRGTTFSDGTYSIGKIENYGTTGYKIWVNEDIPDSAFGPSNVHIVYITTSSLANVITLADCFRICLQATQLKLDLLYGGSLVLVDTTDKDDILSNVKINPNTFVDSSNIYESCFDVLDKICTRFKITIFQSFNTWYAIRWQELRYYNNNLKGYLYDWHINLSGTISTGITEKLEYGTGIDIEYGLNNMIDRPLRHYQEKFTYEQPKNIIKNGDLDDLGDYAQKVIGTSTDYWVLYDWLDWTDTFNKLPLGTGYRPRYIAVKYNQYGIELERSGFIPWQYSGEDYNQPACIPFPVNKGDSVRIKFSFRTSKFIDGGDGTYIRITFGNSYINGSGELIPSPWYYEIPNDENWGEWHEVDILLKNAPNDNLIQIALTSIADKNPFPGPYVDNSFTTKTGTFYKDFTIEYFPNVIGQSNVQGQIHRSYQGGVIKNVDEIDIYVDSSQKNYAKGTLFRNGFTNGLNNRAIEWKDGRIDKVFSLGEIITKQQLLWRKYLRNKYEGTLFPIIDADDNIISANKIIELLIKPNFYFIFGKLELNYREDMANFTLCEIWNADENDSIRILNDFPPPDYIFIPKGIEKDKSIVYKLKYF